MSTQNAPADSPQAMAPSAPVPVPLASSRAWLRAALFLAGAAQLITISALVRADPMAATWSTLLLAIAPAPLVAGVAFAPAPAARPAAVVAAVVLVAGIAGAILHTGLFFIPGLVALVVGGLKLCREPA